MRGVNNHISAPKSSTAWIAAFKNQDIRGASPSLLRMRDILLQTFFARFKFLTTSGQSLSVAKITRPRYLK